MNCFPRLSYPALALLTAMPAASAAHFVLPPVGKALQPAHFFPLKSCRVGTPYADSLASLLPGENWQCSLTAGALPPGLNLEPDTATICGTPLDSGSYSFRILATSNDGKVREIQCALAVFSLEENEIKPGQKFSAPGPHKATGPLNFNFTFTSSFDGVSYPLGSFKNALQVLHPQWKGVETYPVYIHHRGRGFNMGDYNQGFAQHLASHGCIYVTVEDLPSFVDSKGTSAATNATYDSVREQGMESASAFQEAAQRWVVEANATPGHALYQRVDVDNIFMGGHSRGGGATHASHIRSFPYLFQNTLREPLPVKGLLYFMATDLRMYEGTVKGNQSIYPIPGPLPRTPSLFIAAEKDGDTVYPLSDQLLDRATGPATMATVYGGVHAFLSDKGSLDQYGAYITREEQMSAMFNLAVAFIKRWSTLDLSLEGMLYNNEYAGNTKVGVTAWRNMAECTVVDDFQSGNPQINALGGSNAMSGGSFSPADSIFPKITKAKQMVSLGLRHNILSLPAKTTSVYTTTIPIPHQNQSKAKCLVFRCGTVDINRQKLKGFDWMTLRVRLSSGGKSSTLTVYDCNAKSTKYLPVYQAGSRNVLDRFVNASLPLSDFPDLDPAQIERIELVFETAPGVTRQFYMDDLRFE